MKILLACDERSSADKFYYDLKRAGLSAAAQIYVLSVSDFFIPLDYKKTRGTRPPDKAYLTHVDQSIDKALTIAGEMSKKLKSVFPRWRLWARSSGGSPAGEILSKAQQWNVDLIVIGSHGRPGVGKLFFGSVAQKVLSGAPCSVRVVRAGASEKESPARIVVGVDGSPGSDAVINHLIRRHWKKGGSAHLITVLNAIIYSVLDFKTYFGPAMRTTPDDSLIKKEWQTKGDLTTLTWVRKMHEEYKNKLEKTGLIVSSLIKEGDPKVVLVNEARRWGADCIFLGAAGHSRGERYQLGGVSTAVAARAHCSVEVIRDKKKAAEEK